VSNTVVLLHCQKVSLNVFVPIGCIFFASSENKTNSFASSKKNCYCNKMIFASNFSLALLSGKSRNAATSVPTEWFVAVLLDSLMSFENDESTIRCFQQR